MGNPKALVLTGFGLNCEVESAHAIALAGAEPKLVHFNQLQQNPKMLDEFQLMLLPGGFSFADDIQSGRVLANKFRFKIFDPFRRFVEEGKPVMGICNGFQMLAQLGALPGWNGWEDRALTLMANESGRFENRWVRLRTEASVCPFAQSMDFVTLPVRHGEGRIALSHPGVLDRLEEQKQIVFRYASSVDGLRADTYPDNPNGSLDAIAGVCNEAGNVMGLMPHPECHVRYVQSPHWALHPPDDPPGGLGGALSSWLGMRPPSPADRGQCVPLFDNIVSQAKRFI